MKNSKLQSNLTPLILLSTCVRRGIRERGEMVFSYLRERISDIGGSASGRKMRGRNFIF
jgi:hypothetical protein